MLIVGWLADYLYITPHEVDRKEKETTEPETGKLNSTSFKSKHKNSRKDEEESLDIFSAAKKKFLHPYDKSGQTTQTNLPKLGIVIDSAAENENTATLHRTSSAFGFKDGNKKVGKNKAFSLVEQFSAHNESYQRELHAEMNEEKRKAYAEGKGAFSMH